RKQAKIRFSLQSLGVTPIRCSGGRPLPQLRFRERQLLWHFHQIQQLSGLPERPPMIFFRAHEPSGSSPPVVPRRFIRILAACLNGAITKWSYGTCTGGCSNVVSL